MDIPTEAAVMILPDVALFPQALLPLRIFEPRYRRMLRDVLERERVFVVAMLRPDQAREIPSSVAGLGLVRVSVEAPDGTSSVVIQGVSRVRLLGTVRYRPYRVHRIEPLQGGQSPTSGIEVLLDELRELVSARIALEISLSTSGAAVGKKGKLGKLSSLKEILSCLAQLSNPEELVDLISCAFLPGGKAQQAILEAVDLEPRIRLLMRYLSADIRSQKQGRTSGR
jgi:Lon protease-like protein